MMDINGPPGTGPGLIEGADGHASNGVGIAGKRPRVPGASGEGGGPADQFPPDEFELMKSLENTLKSTGMLSANHQVLERYFFKSG